jgi:hypothetical protein
VFTKIEGRLEGAGAIRRKADDDRIAGHWLGLGQAHSGTRNNAAERAGDDPRVNLNTLLIVL